MKKKNSYPFGEKLIKEGKGKKVFLRKKKKFQESVYDMCCFLQKRFTTVFYACIHRYSAGEQGP
jgi:hypothetical protein